MIYESLESFEMWCWRRMEKISWAYHVRNEEVLLRVNEQRNILHEIRKRKANWIGHILRRNCLPVHRTATYRCNDTRDCIVQFCPPDDEHMCSKHVEA